MTKEELTAKVETALAEIRPFLQNDGGDIELVSVEDNIANVRLLGACTNCSINTMTLKMGVEMTIRRHAPQIEKVVNL
ncbi:MAG TPA: NifU family protein [Flavobacteriaceae bacterium]|nr:NifU family protein [Flavobacteriaceae bacterium]